MKAIAVENPGPEGRLVMVERPDPVPAAGEVLVRIEAAAVNSADRMLVQGRIAGVFGADLAAEIPGIDGAGTIVAVGQDELVSRIGERVVLNGAITCDVCERCLVGDNGMCADRRALGQLANGTYAELVAVPTANALPIPDALSFEEAAAIPSVTLTAWQALVRRGDVRAGETVLVSAAASGVGSMAIQVAKHLGAHVLAVASTREKVRHALLAGADIGVVASTNLYADLATAAPSGVDLVMDIVGASMWPTWIRALRRSGRIVTCASDWSTPPELSGFGPKQLSLLATGPFGSKPDADAIVDLALRGTIRAFVGDVLPLANAATAHARLADRTAIGKLILRL